MEKRLALYEKIKDGKLDKLTVKEGDKLVRLNIKVDLLDPNVDIPEKVLTMLDAYANKQMQQPVAKSNPIVQETVSSPSPSNQAVNVSTGSSPSKRVRFSDTIANEASSAPIEKVNNK